MKRAAQDTEFAEELVDDEASKATAKCTSSRAISKPLRASLT
jgi:hypothetical protein